MALAHKIKKDAFSKLSKDIQAEYKEDGEDYVLDVTGIEDGAAAVRAKNIEKEEKKAALKRVKDLETELETVTAERDGMLSGTIPKADAEKLKTQYEARIIKLQKERDDGISVRDAQLTDLTVNSAANGIATKLFTNPVIGMPHVRSRLKAEFKDGKMTTVVLDKNGQPTDLTPADLEKELASDENFKPILTASRGSGGGANGANRGGGASSGKSVDRATFDAMPQAERAAHAKSGGTVTD